MSSITFENSTPILRVEDLASSVAYYTGVLGFTVDWSDRVFGQVTRGDTHLMLSQGDQGHAGTWVYVGVSDADALLAEIAPRGATVRLPPTNYPWGVRELHVIDPDGHVLRFGSEATPGEPIGEWLDGDGVRWIHQPDGGWRSAD